MLKTITNLSTKNISTHTKDNKINPELLLALRKQRLEERLEAIEPCLFKYTQLLTQKQYTLGNDEENPGDTALDNNNTANISLSIKLKA